MKIILSAFYGVLKPMDGITSYRLEMQVTSLSQKAHMPSWLVAKW